jgi:hypothetical protein
VQQQLQDSISKQSTKAPNKYRQNKVKKLQQQLRDVRLETTEVQRGFDMFDDVRLAWEELLPSLEQGRQQESGSNATVTGSKQQQLVQGSSIGFDADNLLQGMLQAAGMAGPVGVGGDSGADATISGGSEVSLDPILDELLLGSSDSDDDEDEGQWHAGDDLGDVLDAEFEQLAPRIR